MDFTSITVELLKVLSHITGGYGLAIILLTVAVRVIMWPLAVSQQKSMKKMQELAPKLKQMQERYKSDPQMLQRKMAEFYKQNSFNPFAGCFTMLIQLPIFFILYGALISPQFNEVAGNSSFLFIDKLNATMKSHAGIAGDKVFGVNPKDTFSVEKNVIVYTNDGAKKEVKLKDPKKAVKVQGDITPGEPIDLKINVDDLDLTFSEIDKIKTVEVAVVNNATKEIEHIPFEKKDYLLVSNIETRQIKEVFHYDVLALIVLFGVSMILSQKVMTKSMKNEHMDPNQKAMQDQMSKLLPIMFIPMFLFIPIPAGVLLYMVVSNIIQIGQTFIINKMIENETPLSESKVSVVE